MRIRKRCSFGRELCLFLVFVISNLSIFRYHLPRKTELCSYWSSVKERSVPIGYGVMEAVFLLVYNCWISCFCHIQPRRL